MARNLSRLLRVAQRTFITSSFVFPESRQIFQCLGFKKCQLDATSSYQLNSFSSRLQHFQSADSDEDVSPEESKRVYRNKKYEELLIPVIENGEPLSTKEWIELQDKLLELENFINKDNIHGIIMGMCCKYRKFDVGTSLLDALTQMGIERNIATLSRYLRLCYECDAGEEETILSIINEIRQRCPVMDSNTADNVIHGLSRTSSWQEGFELLKDIRLTAVPSMSTFNVLAKVAIENGELSMGWNLIEEMMQADKRPSPAVYKAWIDQSSRAQASEAKVMISQLLNFWADYDLRPSMDVASHLRNWFEKDNYSWEGCFISLSPWGSCLNCKTPLRNSRVSTSEFERMRDQFFEQVIVGSNVFLKTNPEELETFQQFLSRSVPYDVVVDGLNVSYSTGILQPQYAVKTLMSVVRQLAELDKKVLVLGRRHMQNWPQREMKFVHEHASVFLAQNVSQDDPFLLYAAMFSGPHTCFVSRDLMRGHMFLLKDKALRRVFKRWQQQRQMQLHSAGRGNVNVMPALRYNPSVQQGPGPVWHIPYDLEFIQRPKQVFEPPKYWLCLRKEG